jgi:hypothetical protein
LPRILKFILFLLLFGLFFEAGLFSSYTIVTSQPPDVGSLINMQTSRIAAIWDSISFGSDDGKSPNTLKILNGDPVIQSLKNKTGLNGVNLETMTATSKDDQSKKEIMVTINAIGYKDTVSGGGSGNKSGGQIVITATEKYTLTATALAKKKTKGVEIETSTIKITSLKKVFNQ